LKEQNRPHSTGFMVADGLIGTHLKDWGEPPSRAQGRAQRTNRLAMAPAKPSTRKLAAARVTRSIEKLWGR
jgi:hypothetical protein